MLKVKGDGNINKGEDIIILEHSKKDKVVNLKEEVNNKGLN